MLVQKQHMSTICLCLLSVLPALTQLSGQTKIQPPPTRIDVPFDSSRAIPAAAEKLDSKTTELELPDVMIYGIDQSTRKMGTKGSPQLVAIESISIDDLYRPIETWIQPAREKPGLLTEHRIHNIQASILGGSYGWAGLNVLYRHPIEKGSAYAFLDYDRWDGQFGNSDFSQGMAKISGSYWFNQFSNVKGSIRYGAGAYGLYGSQITDARYQSQTVNVTAMVQHTFTPLLTGDLNLAFANTNGKFDSSTTWAETGDFWFDVSSNLNLRYKQINAAATINFMNEVIDFHDSTATGKNSIFAAKLQVSRKIARYIKLSTALGWQNLTSELESNRSALWTEARVVVSPSHFWGASFFINSGLDYFTLSSLRQINPFMKNQVSLTPERTKVGFQALTELSPESGTKFYLRVKRRYADDVRFWQQDSTDQLFEQQHVNNVKLTDIELGLSLEFNKTYKLQASFTTYTDKLNQDSVIIIDRLPYRPAYSFPVDLIIDLPLQTRLSSRGIFVGPRKLNLVTRDELDRYFDLSFQIEKQFGDHFIVALQGLNLLDAEYKIWQGYQEMGTRIVVKLNAQF